MQIKALFEGVARSTVASFMKISEGATSQGQAVNALQGTWELLKFSIGSAIATVLEGLLPVILPIIEGITDWIQRNEKLVGWFIIIGIVVGTVLMVFGSLVIGIEAIANSIIKLISGTSSLNALGKAINGVKFGGLLTGFSALLVWILIIAAIIVVLAKAWKHNFANIQEFVKGTFSNIGSIVMAFIDFWDGVFSGDSNKMLKSVLKFAFSVVAIIARMAIFLKDIILNTVVPLLTGIFTKAIALGMKLGAVISMLAAGEFDSTGLKKTFEDIDKTMDDVKKSTDDLILNSDVNVFFSQEELTREFKVATDAINAMEMFKEPIENADALYESVSEIKTLIEAGALSDASGRKWVEQLFPDNLADFNFWLSLRNGLDDLSQIQTSFSFSDELNNAMGSIGNSYNDIIAKTSVASSASQNMAQQNALETESWNMKTDALRGYNSELEYTNRLISIQGGNSLPITLNRATGNFVTNNL
jgi:hypothetical protein